MGNKTTKEIIASNRMAKYHSYPHGKYLQELCVYGFIREYCNIDIPDVLKELCLSLYLIVIDQWNKKLSHKTFAIDEASREIFSTVTGGRRHAFGSLIIGKGEIMIWSIKITNDNPQRHDNNRAVMFGISNTSEIDNWNEKSGAYHFCDTEFNGSGYGYYAWTGYTHTSLRAERNPYGPSWDKDDIITMTLDMTGKKYGVLSYAINGKDLGVAFDDIDIDGNYRMSVCMHSKDSLQLVENPGADY